MKVRSSVPYERPDFELIHTLISYVIKLKLAKSFIDPA